MPAWKWKPLKASCCRPFSSFSFSSKFPTPCKRTFLAIVICGRAFPARYRVLRENTGLRICVIRDLPLQSPCRRRCPGWPCDHHCACENHESTSPKGPSLRLRIPSVRMHVFQNRKCPSSRRFCCAFVEAECTAHNVNARKGCEWEAECGLADFDNLF